MGWHRCHIVRGTTPLAFSWFTTSTQTPLGANCTSLHLFVEYQEAVDRRNLRQHIENQHDKAKRCGGSIEDTGIVAPWRVREREREKKKVRQTSLPGSNKNGHGPRRKRYAHLYRQMNPNQRHTLDHRNSKKGSLHPVARSADVTWCTIVIEWPQGE